MHWHAVSGSGPIVGRYALQECACVYECGLWRASAPVCICGFALDLCMCVRVDSWVHGHVCGLGIFVCASGQRCILHACVV